MHAKQTEQSILSKKKCLAKRKRNNYQKDIALGFYRHERTADIAAIVSH